MGTGYIQSRNEVVSVNISPQFETHRQEGRKGTYTMSRLRAGPRWRLTPRLLLLPVNEELMETKPGVRPSLLSNPENVALVHLVGAQTAATGQNPDSSPPSHWISKLVCPEPISCCFRNIHLARSLSPAFCSAYSIQPPRTHHLVWSELLPLAPSFQLSHFSLKWNLLILRSWLRAQISSVLESMYSRRNFLPNLHRGHSSVSNYRVHLV